MSTRGCFNSPPSGGYRLSHAQGAYLLRRERQALLEKDEKLERFSIYGYRRIAAVLGWNRKVVQRICQIKGWQVRKRAKGHRPRAKALASIADRRDERWATDLAMLWCGRDRHCHLALVIGCCSREILG